jgi:phosphoribosylformylglycinamidine synthase
LLKILNCNSSEDSVFESKLKANDVSSSKLVQPSSTTLDLGSITLTKYKRCGLEPLSFRPEATALHKRFDNYKNQPTYYSFPAHFTGRKPVISTEVARPKAAIIREKGSNLKEKWLCT